MNCVRFNSRDEISNQLGAYLRDWDARLQLKQRTVRAIGHILLHPNQFAFALKARLVLTDVHVEVEEETIRVGVQKVPLLVCDLKETILEFFAVSNVIFKVVAYPKILGQYFGLYPEENTQFNNPV